MISKGHIHEIRFSIDRDSLHKNIQLEAAASQIYVCLDADKHL